MKGNNNNSNEKGCMIMELLEVVGTVLFIIPLLIVYYIFKAMFENIKAHWLIGKNTIGNVKVLVEGGKYTEALSLLDATGLYRLCGELYPIQRHDVTKLWIICQEKLGRPQVAVVELARTLSSILRKMDGRDSDIKEWPWFQYLLDKWIALYKTCPPVDVKFFHFNNEHHSMLMETAVLLNYAIEEGCQSPIGFENYAGSHSEIERLQHLLLSDLKIGDSVFIVGGTQWTFGNWTCFAILKRENGNLERIKITRKEYSQYYG